MKTKFVQISMAVLWVVMAGMVYSFGVLVMLGYPFTGAYMREVYPMWVILAVIISATIVFPWVFFLGARHLTTQRFFSVLGGLCISTAAFSTYYVYRLGMHPHSSFFLMIAVGLCMLVFAFFSENKSVASSEQLGD